MKTEPYKKIFPHTPMHNLRPKKFPLQWSGLNRRNDLRKVLEESDDALGDLETTKSTTVKSTTVKITAAPTTTTRSTTKSTTTASTTKSSTTQRSTKRYYAPSKSPEDVVKTPKTYFSNSFYHNNNPNNINENSELPPPTPAPAKPTINPFYYGFNRLPQNSTTQRSYRQLHFTTTNTPYSFQYFTPTKTVNLQASTPATNNDVDNNYYESQRPTNVEKPKSSTYNPVFDIYFKQIGRQRTTSTNRP